MKSLTLVVFPRSCASAVGVFFQARVWVSRRGHPCSTAAVQRQDAGRRTGNIAVSSSKVARSLSTQRRRQLSTPHPPLDSRVYGTRAHFGVHSTLHSRSFLPCSATSEPRLLPPPTNTVPRTSVPTVVMDFAPYQSSPPEHSRPLSPRSPLGSPRQSLDRRPFPPPRPSPPPLQHPQPQRGWQASIPGAYPGADAHREGVSEFDTSLGIRLDYEACVAYLALPPMGAILLLILERKSDYVR